MSGSLPSGIDQLPSGKYRARYRDADGSQHSKSFDRLRDATTWRTRQMASVSAGAHVAVSSGKVTFEDFALERMAAWRRHKPSTRQQVEWQMRAHVFPVFGSQPIGRIKPAHVEAWVTAKELDLAPATLHVAFSWMRRVFKEAQKQRLITDSPCDDIELPAIPKRKVQPLSLDAIDALHDAMPDHWQATVMVAAWAGLRQGEVLGLRKHRLNLIGHRDDNGNIQPPSIYVAEQLQTLVGPPQLVPPKTKKSVRRVPIPTVLVERLAMHLSDFPAEDEGLIFRTTQGNPVRRNRFHVLWTRAVADAGLPAGTRFHDLRHTYASLLIKAGESVTVVSKRLGHASAVETLDTYSHMWPDSDGHTVDVLNAAYTRHVSRDVSPTDPLTAFPQVRGPIGG